MKVIVLKEVAEDLEEDRQDVARGFIPRLARAPLPTMKAGATKSGRRRRPNFKAALFL